jgi:hypothetical protein
MHRTSLQKDMLFEVKYEHWKAYNMLHDINAAVRQQICNTATLIYNNGSPTGPTQRLHTGKEDMFSMRSNPML